LVRSTNTPFPETVALMASAEGPDGVDPQITNPLTAMINRIDIVIRIFLSISFYPDQLF
jgi:hypothetical protein